MSEFQPKIVTFLCNWCSYGAADLAGVSRFQYPPNMRIIRIPCSGRVSAKMIIHAIRNGADGVWISGCHPGDCHYINGNYKARRRMKLLKEILPRFGVDRERIRLTWIGASDGIEFAQIMTRFTEQVREMGPCRPRPESTYSRVG